jgi:hypothetical protein
MDLLAVLTLLGADWQVENEDGDTVIEKFLQALVLLL